MTEKGEPGEAVNATNGTEHKVHLLGVLIKQVPVITTFLCIRVSAVFIFDHPSLLGVYKNLWLH